MNLTTKLRNLRRHDNLVLYRWTAGRQRIADVLIPLTALRFNSIVCDGGRVSYSSAAPVLFMEHGRPTIRLMDHDVVCPVEGRRSGTNLPARFLREGEDAVEARYVTLTEMTDKITGWRADRVVSMGGSPVVPICGIVKPRFYRITRQPSTLKPLYSTQALKVLGMSRGVPMDEFRKAFAENINLFGLPTGDGFIVPHEYIASGGCLVAAASGITARAGSVVHELPLTLFAAEIDNLHWEVQNCNTKS